MQACLPSSSDQERRRAASSAPYFRRIPGWQRLGSMLLVAGPLTLMLLVSFVATFHVSAVVAGTGVAGLTERLLISEIHAWYAALGWRGFRVRES